MNLYNLINMFLCNLLTHHWILGIEGEPLWLLIKIWNHSDNFVQIHTKSQPWKKKKEEFSYDIWLAKSLQCCYKTYICSILAFPGSWTHDFGVVNAMLYYVVCYSSGQPRSLWRFFAIVIGEKLCSRGQPGGLFIKLLQIATHLSNGGTGREVIEWRMEKTEMSWQNTSYAKEKSYENK